jgi:hypothetical protein
METLKSYPALFTPLSLVNPLKAPLEAEGGAEPVGVAVADVGHAEEGSAEEGHAEDEGHLEEIGAEDAATCTLSGTH